MVQGSDLSTQVHKDSSGMGIKIKPLRLWNIFIYYSENTMHKFILQNDIRKICSIYM